MTNSSPGTLSALAAGSVFKNDASLLRLLQESDELPQTVFGVIDFSNLVIAYAGKRISEWTGLQASDLVSGGIRSILGFVQPEQLQHLALIQAAFLQQVRAPEFDPRTVRYLDMAWTAVTPSGKLPLLSTMVALTYTSSRDLGCAVCFQVKDNEESLELLQKSKRLLRSIKERHNEIYVHPTTVVPDRPGTIQTTNPIIDKITPRELEVLVLIAKGYSTPDIASHLAIAANTVESHRKKLLEKFDARNVAELMKKASKVYWLE
jgi:DNA-binding CsgD family transcriptional regulator